MEFLTENGLDPTVFPSMLKLETDVVRMVINPYCMATRTPSGISPRAGRKASCWL
jgi:glutamate/tyrosine decarboxylase-like PLP-dependent enzyme